MSYGDADKGSNKTPHWSEDAASSQSLAQELPYTATKSAKNVPVVTVFGAGVAGLTAAHELIERGFRVQVVEPAPHPEQEYACEVGGLASSQEARLNETRRLHWMLYETDAQAGYLAANPQLLRIPEELELHTAEIAPAVREPLMRTIRALREEPLQPTQVRYALPQKIALPVSFAAHVDTEAPFSAAPFTEAEGLAAVSKLFAVECSAPSDDHVTPVQVDLQKQLDLQNWLGAITDLHGEIQARLGQFDPVYLNVSKVGRICQQLLEAVIDYSRCLREALDRLRRYHGEIYSFDAPSTLQACAEAQQLCAQVRRREILLVEIRGHCNLWPSDSRNEAVGLVWAKVVKAWIAAELRKAAAKVRAALPANATPEDSPANPLGEAVRFSVGYEATASESTLTCALVQRLAVVVNDMRATQERIQLLDDLDHAEQFLECSGVSNQHPLGQHDVNHLIASNFVDFRCVEHVVMGEHGFRYFPGFYRHVFDTMGRTPLLDEQSRNTGLSLLDRLVVPPPARLGTPGPDSEFREFKESASDSLEEVRQDLEWLTKRLGFSIRDELRYTVQLLKFLSSCPERRQLYQKFSWWEFIDGKSEYDRPDAEAAMHSDSGYSEKGTKLLRSLPQLLVAMSADESDALTNGNIAVQLLLDTLQTGGAKDRMLNGPTSEAWLEPWKRYLKKQGVSFFVGSLARLEWDGDEAIPVIAGPGATSRPLPESAFDVYVEHGMSEPTPDFYVSALPYAVQTETVWRIDGLEEKKIQFDAAAGAIRALVRAIGAEVKEENKDDVWALLDSIGPCLWFKQLDNLNEDYRRQYEFWAGARHAARDNLPRPRLHRAHYELYAPQLSADDAERCERLRPPPLVSSGGFFGERAMGPQGTSALDMLKELEPKIRSMRIQLADLSPPPPNVGLMRRALALLERKLHFLRFQSVQLLDIEKAITSCIGRLLLVSAPTPKPGDPLRNELLALQRLLRAGSAEIDRARAIVLRRLDGDFTRLMAFDVQSNRRNESGWFRHGRDPQAGPYSVDRDADGLPQPQFAYPLRDLTGIQYYFRQLVRVGQGRFTLPDAPWGITGVGQAYFWSKRPSLSRGYIGQLSVDIANFYAPYAMPGDRIARTAWQSTAREIATGVWDQIVSSASRDYAQRVAAPRYFQIDRGLRFVDATGCCARNDNMLLINLPGQWQSRAGIRLDDTGREIVGYTVSSRRWVMAGTYMATLTRLTTMEAANESGRQAVNAILNELFKTGQPGLYNSGGTYAGDFCRLWDPQQNEQPDFEPLKRLDRALLDRNIPHFLDVVGLRKKVDAMPKREDPSSTPAYNLSESLRLAFAQMRQDWSFLPEVSSSRALGIDAKTAELRKLANHASQVIEMIMKTVSSQNMK